MGLILLTLQDTLDEYLTIQKEAKLLNPAQTDDGNQSPRWVSVTSCYYEMWWNLVFSFFIMCNLISNVPKWLKEK